MKNNIKDYIFEVKVGENNKIVNKAIMDSEIPDEILIVMIKRDNKVVIPKGFTIIKPNDTLVLTSENNEIMNSFLDEIR